MLLWSCRSQVLFSSCTHRGPRGPTGKKMTCFCRTAVFLLVVLVQGDTPVRCVFGGSCVLPCRFQPNSKTLLHWIKMNGNDVRVHSYYDDQDQLGYQDPRYKGRTSLSRDQISGGDASLRLARVNLEDQGRYLCYASASQYDQKTTVTLTVTAPVTMVDIQLVDDVVTCKSGGIYPRPQLTWSVTPHLDTVLQNTAEVHEAEHGLYDITGSLTTVDTERDTEPTYCCSVQNEDCTSRATIRKHPQMQCAPKREVLLPCDTHSPGDVMEPTLYDISWTFNHDQIILSRQAGQEKVVEGEWQQHVRDLSDSGSLLLYVNSSAQSEGTYRCTRRYTDRADVTHIELKILEDHIEDGSLVAFRVVLRVMLVVIPVIIIIFTIFILIWIKKTTKT